MNYIAHIHIAHHTQTSLLGNFLGDFIKGNLIEQLPNELANGVRLHRKIDQFTDNHPLVKTLREKFPSTLRRMSGVIIDIAFDHCLLMQWSQFTQQSEEQILALFYRQLAGFNSQEFTVNHFKQLSESLLADKWLIHYRNPATCLRAFNSIERRLNYKIIFACEAYQFLRENQAFFNTTFASFYPDLLQHGIHCKKQLADQYLK